MINGGEVLVERKGEWSHAEGLPHILPDPLVTHVLTLCLSVGRGAVEIEEVQFRMVALF